MVVKVPMLAFVITVNQLSAYAVALFCGAMLLLHVEVLERENISSPIPNECLSPLLEQVAFPCRKSIKGRRRLFFLSGVENLVSPSLRGFTLRLVNFHQLFTSYPLFLSRFGKQRTACTLR